MFPNSKHILLAIKYASNVNLARFKHGCVIYDEKHIISCGFNKCRSNPILYKYGYKNGAMLHAESDAILKSRCELKGSSILVVRLGKNKLCNSKPCAHCMAMIIECGIKHVYYSDKFGKIQELNLNFKIDQ